MSYKVVFAEENGTAAQFEDQLIQKAEQASRTGRNGLWIMLAERYYIQKRLLSTNPYPEEFNTTISEDKVFPIVKPITKKTKLERLYRWGISFGFTGNHRILYTIHNYHQVVILHYFNKQYNGMIKRTDIEPAEKAYLKYLERYPSHYPFMKG